MLREVRCPNCGESVAVPDAWPEDEHGVRTMLRDECALGSPPRSEPATQSPGRTEGGHKS